MSDPLQEFIAVMWGRHAEALELAEEAIAEALVATRSGQTPRRALGRARHETEKARMAEYAARSAIRFAADRAQAVRP